MKPEPVNFFSPKPILEPDDEKYDYLSIFKQ